MVSSLQNSFLVSFLPDKPADFYSGPLWSVAFLLARSSLLTVPLLLLVPGILLLPTPTSPLMSVPVTWEVGAQLIYLKEADDEETWAALLWGRCRLSCLRGRVGLQWCQILREPQLLALRPSRRMLARTGVR